MYITVMSYRSLVTQDFHTELMQNKLKSFSPISKIGMGREHHKYYKHTKFCKNLRNGLKFLKLWSRNDPYLTEG